MIQFIFKRIIESVFIEKMQQMTLTEQYYDIDDNGYINGSFDPTASNARNNHAARKSELFLVTPRNNSGTSSRELSLVTCILLVVCFDFLLVSICLLVMHLLIK
jgi:hypothetical protein